MKQSRKKKHSLGELTNLQPQLLLPLSVNGITAAIMQLLPNKLKASASAKIRGKQHFFMILPLTFPVSSLGNH